LRRTRAGVPALDAETRRQLTLSAPRSPRRRPPAPGAAEEVARLKAEMQASMARAGTLRGAADQRKRHRSGDGHYPKSDELKEMWGELARQRRQADEGRLRRDGRADETRGQRARLCRHGRAVALELRHDPGRVSALTEKIWNEVKPLYNSFTATPAPS
jgi:peptidyl-dipeptidase A